MTEPTPAELVARARALQPLLREHAAKTDADRRVPAECIDALGEAGLFKVAVPRRYGGEAAHRRAELDVSRARAQGGGGVGSGGGGGGGRRPPPPPLPPAPPPPAAGGGGGGSAGWVVALVNVCN